jgi:thiosulfate dehydrogenase (quinone) large subunit
MTSVCFVVPRAGQAYDAQTGAARSSGQALIANFTSDMDLHPPSNGEAKSDRKIGYLVLRFSLGLSLLMHGLTRLPHLSAFADGMVKEFVDTVLPPLLVRPFALGLVFVEAIVGLLVLLGLLTREALIVGSATMAALIFGTALRSDWNVVAIQLLYCAIYAALLAAREYNAYSLDSILRR